MDIIFILFVFLAGYFLGTIRTYIKFAREMKEAADSLGIDLDKELTKKETPEKTVYKLIVEKHGNMLYLFDREKNDFICQGSSIQELAELAKKYKNIIMATAIYDDKVFMFHDGKLKEYTNNES